MLSDFKSIIEAASRKNELIAVTHAGLFHSDELACTVLLSLYLEGSGINLKLFRTFEVSKIPKDDNVIVYDIGEGLLDHNKDEEKVEGRQLSSLGKLWRFGKQEFMEKFEISNGLWGTIDKNFVSKIDKSDTSGITDPLTYSINCIRNITPESEAWEKCFEHMKNTLVPILKCSKISTAESKILRSSPILTINGKKFRFTDSWCYGFDYKMDGHIWKTEDGTYKVRLFKEFDSLKLKNIKNGENENIIYISPSGKNGQVRTLKDLESII